MSSVRDVSVDVERDASGQNALVSVDSGDGSVVAWIDGEADPATIRELLADVESELGWIVGAEGGGRS